MAVRMLHADTTDSAYREINVYIDGCLAAAFYPALVVYTGGICPLLWRPLVSLLALDIPAYRLDLTAFAGALNDGAAHTFSFDVVDGDPPKSSGVWYIDPVMILELDHDATAARYHGAVDPATCLTSVAAAAQRTVRVDRELGTTVGSFHFTVNGTNTKSGESRQQRQLQEQQQERGYSHSYTLSAQNSQPKHDAGPTVGSMSTLISTSDTQSGQRVDDSQLWNYSVADNSRYNKETFLLRAKVNLTKERTKSLNRANAGPAVGGLLGLLLSQENSGLYNRSLSNHTLIFAEDNNSTEAFRFYTDSTRPPCYTRYITAAGGHVTTDVVNAQPVDTQFPCYAFISQLESFTGMRLCGSEFCGFML